MSDLRFMSPYLKGGGDSARRANRIRYFATRPGVEVLSDGGSQPATKKQKAYIQRLLRAFPDARELLEYEDYLKNQTQESASEFIRQAREDFAVPMSQRENYLDYVSHRPGVELRGEHGLWTSGGKVENLSEAVREVAEHPGNVWTPVVAIRRQDAERLGYDNAENWRALVNASLCDIAKGYKIHPDHLRWYAAFHEKEKSVHIHMVVFSSDPKEGYLTPDGIRQVKSAFARRIFQQDLMHIYEQKTAYRNQLQQNAAEAMQELIRQMRDGTLENPQLEDQIEALARRLRTVRGKKVYGYLPPEVKLMVDGIVDVLAADEHVAKAYDLWNEMRESICRTYSEHLPERLPLSKQKEFKPVRNIETHGFEQSGIKIQRGGTILADSGTHLPDMEGVFAGGDCVTGPATVIRAIAAGKVAAANIDEYLGYCHTIEAEVEIPAPHLSDFTPRGRVSTTEREAGARKMDFQCIECGMTLEEAQRESARCLRCDHFGYGVFKGGREEKW